MCTYSFNFDSFLCFIHCYYVYIGVVALSSTALMGLLIIPYRKKSVTDDFHKRVNILQVQIDTVIMNNFERELQNINDKIIDAIQPYSRFVEIEKKRVEHATDDLIKIRQNMKEIKKRL